MPYAPGDYHDDYTPRPAHRQDSSYSLDPQAHHDAYYNPPYDPSPHDESPHPYGAQPDHYWQDDDRRPMIGGGTSFGPDPHAPLDHDEYAPGDDQHLQPENPFHDEPQPTPSPAPIKRWKTVKEVQLFKGNLVLDCPIPPRLLNQVQHAQPPERDVRTPPGMRWINSATTLYTTLSI